MTISGTEQHTHIKQSACGEAFKMPESHSQNDAFFALNRSMLNPCVWRDTKKSQRHMQCCLFQQTTVKQIERGCVSTISIFLSKSSVTNMFR